MENRQFEAAGSNQSTICATTHDENVKYRPLDVNILSRSTAANQLDCAIIQEKRFTIRLLVIWVMWLFCCALGSSGNPVLVMRPYFRGDANPIPESMQKI